MARNIEIKARAGNFKEQLRIAAGLSGQTPELIHQVDTFFNVPRGRLKLREFGDGTGELINYDRPDSPGPKQSTYVISGTVEPDSLKRALDSSIGISAVVKKKRTLFLSGQTRVHFDEVEGLGCFIELEVVLVPGQEISDGESVTREWMLELGIQQSDLVAGAYVDLLKEEGAGNKAGM
ncbi:MAG: class IV adenylate cyclase [Bacteroidales bacterium]